MIHVTRQERLALQVTALLLVTGGGVRLLASGGDKIEWEKTAPDADTSSLTTAAPVPAPGLDEVRARANALAAREEIRDEPLAPGEKLDPNRANVDQLQRLPRVGPSLAGRIVDWRETHGRFRSLADLDEVSGVGPALLSSIAPHLTLPPAPSSTAGGAGGPIDINSASATELAELPGVGPVLATRIIQWRKKHGAFRSMADLDEVSGIGPAMMSRLAPLVALPP